MKLSKEVPKRYLDIPQGMLDGYVQYLDSGSTAITRAMNETRRIWNQIINPMEEEVKRELGQRR